MRTQINSNSLSHCKGKCNREFLSCPLQAVLYTGNSNHSEDASDRRADQIYRQLVSPVGSLSFFTGDWQDSEPDAAKDGTHGVHAEPGTVQGQGQEGNGCKSYGTDNKGITSAICNTKQNEKEEQECSQDFLYKVQRYIFARNND